MKCSVKEEVFFTHRFAFVNYFTEGEIQALKEKAQTIEQELHYLILHFSWGDDDFGVAFIISDRRNWTWKSDFILVNSFIENEHLYAESVSTVSAYLEDMLLPCQLHEFSSFMLSRNDWAYTHSLTHCAKWKQTLEYFYTLALRPFQIRLQFAEIIQVTIQHTALESKYWNTNILFRKGKWDEIQYCADELLDEIIACNGYSFDEHPEWVFAFYFGLGHSKFRKEKIRKAFDLLSETCDYSSNNWIACNCMMWFWEGNDFLYFSDLSILPEAMMDYDPFPFMAKPYMVARLNESPVTNDPMMHQWLFSNGYPAFFLHSLMSGVHSNAGLWKEALTSLHFALKGGFFSRITKLRLVEMLFADKRDLEACRYFARHLLYHYFSEQDAIYGRRKLQLIKEDLQWLQNKRVFFALEAVIQEVLAGFSATLLYSKLEPNGRRKQNAKEPHELLSSVCTIPDTNLDYY